MMQQRGSANACGIKDATSPKALAFDEGNTMNGRLSRMLQVFRKAAARSPRKLLKALLPIKIDQLLYVWTPEKASEKARRSPNEVTRGELIERFDKERLDGDRSVDRRLICGHLCYAAYVDNQLAHRSWVSQDIQLPRQFGFDAQAAVIGDCNTLAEFRGRHIYAHVLASIQQDVLCGRLSRPLYILVSPRNVASMRGIERAGFARIAHLTGVRVCGFIINKCIGE